MELWMNDFKQIFLFWSLYGNGESCYPPIYLILIGAVAIKTRRD